MERQAYDRLLQESLGRHDTMGGPCRLLHRVCPRPGVLSLEGRQAHEQCTLAKNEIKTRSKRDHRSSVEDFGPTCAEPAPTSSLTSAPAHINPLFFLEVQGLYTAGEATRGASRGQNLWKGWLREASRQDCGFAEWLRRASRMFVPQTSLTFALPCC